MNAITIITIIIVGCSLLYSVVVGVYGFIKKRKQAKRVRKEFDNVKEDE